MLFTHLVSAVSIRSFRRVGQRVGQGENSPLKNCAAVIKDYWSQSSARKPYSEPTIITRSAAEYKLLTWCHCPFGRWLFLCRRKNFQNRLFKTQFSVGLNRRTFEEASGEAEVNILWTFVKRGLKSAFLLPTTWETFSEGFEQATQARKCKWSVNFLEKASKNRVPVAYAVRGFFSVRHRSKRKILSDQIGRVIDGRKISSPLN